MHQHKQTGAVLWELNQTCVNSSYQNGSLSNTIDSLNTKRCLQRKLKANVADIIVNTNPICRIFHTPISH